jgi:cell wall-associated NlpC family hydrolase
MAIEIVDLPIKMLIFHSYLYVYQWVKLLIRVKNSHLTSQNGDVMLVSAAKYRGQPSRIGGVDVS